MSAHIEMCQQNVTQTQENTMSTDECNHAFAVMKQAESASYVASHKAGIARDAWNAACRARAIVQAPELVPLMEKVERLECELVAAKAAVRTAANKTDAQNLFKRWAE